MSETPVREIPYDRFRRTTAKRMTLSVTTKPQLTLHRHAALTKLEAGLTDQQERCPDAGISLTGALLAAISRGVAASRVNGVVNEHVIQLYESVDLGVAVDVNGSLVVPVIRDAARLSVADLGAELKALAARARAAELRPEDVNGATFTVSNLGPMGVELFTPIINPPQLAILGLGAVSEAVVMVDGALTSERRVGLSLSFDHAATDGADAARVLADIAASIEQADALEWVAPKSRASAV